MFVVAENIFALFLESPQILFRDTNSSINYFNSLLEMEHDEGRWEIFDKMVES
jgi:hypothetical protein